eukprot:gene1874-7945_t
MELSYRRLCPGDLPAIVELHEKWFPIEYPMVFYNKATSVNSPYYSIVCVDGRDGSICGLIVGRVMRNETCDQEDEDILAAAGSPTAGTAPFLMPPGKLGFDIHKLLTGYYEIKGVHQDAYSCVKYTAPEASPFCFGTFKEFLTNLKRIFFW